MTGELVSSALDGRGTECPELVAHRLSISPFQRVLCGRVGYRRAPLMALHQRRARRRGGMIWRSATSSL